MAIAAVALGRERMSARRLSALVLASGGLALVVAGGGTGAIDPAGAALGVAAAVLYSAYILVSDGISRRVPARLLATLVCSGAAARHARLLRRGGLAHGRLGAARRAAAGRADCGRVGWPACLAAVSTVGAISLFLAGLRRAGPTAASILATVEPLVTVVLAFRAFGEALGGIQVVGGLLLLAAVPVLQAPLPRIRTSTYERSTA